MVRVTALFGHPENPDAFEEHYANTHTPLVQKIPNLQRFDRARSSPRPTEASRRIIVLRICGLRAWSRCRVPWVRRKDRRRRRTYKT
jgi:uncharacterized protein (TIGR02118 family)